MYAAWRKVGVWAVAVAAWTSVLCPGAAGGQSAPVDQVEVPLRVLDGRLLVPVETAAGERLTFQLGTGSAETILARSVAERLGPAPTLELGGHTMSVESVHTVADDELRVGETPVDGIVSATFLGDFDVLIDAPGGRLVLRPAGRGGDWGGVRLGEPTPIRVLHGVVLGIDVLVNGVAVPGLLELGTPAVIVNPAAAAAAAVRPGGATLELGGTVFENLDVQDRHHEVFARVPGEGSFALVGSPVVLDCVAALSWVRQTLRMCVR